MMQVFLFALVLGGGLLAVSLFSDSDHGGVDHHHEPADAYKFLSLRSLIYFLFTFGGVGTALSLTWRGAGVLVIAIALLLGVAVSGVTTAVFDYLKRTDSGAREGDDAFLGLAARVIVPIGGGSVGKVQVQRGGRTFELLASPFSNDAAEAPPEAWRSVVIVEMRGGTALVSPVDELPVQVN